MSAIPIGVPGWPEFAFSTASTARNRIVLTQRLSRSVAALFGWLLSSAALTAALACAAVSATWLPGSRVDITFLLKDRIILLQRRAPCPLLNQLSRSKGRRSEACR